MSEDFSEEEDFPEDFSLDESLSPSSDDEDLASFSEEEEYSSVEGSAEAEEEEESSPQAANINADEIKSARNFFHAKNIVYIKCISTKKKPRRLGRVPKRFLSGSAEN